MARTVSEIQEEILRQKNQVLTLLIVTPKWRFGGFGCISLPL